VTKKKQRAPIPKVRKPTGVLALITGGGGERDHTYKKGESMKIGPFKAPLMTRPKKGRKERTN